MRENLTFVEKENNLVETLQEVLVVITEILERKSHKNTVDATFQLLSLTRVGKFKILFQICESLGRKRSNNYFTGSFNFKRRII